MENDVDIEKLQSHFEDFLNNTEEARHLSERDRDYYDHKQWTEDEVAKLRARGQAPIIVNRIKPKVEGLKGLLIQQRTDPKAFPRTQKHEQAAESITDALRFVDDSNDLDNIELDVAENVFIEGYGGAITEVKRKRDEFEINIRHIPWDRLYFDPHSRKLDFSDAKYMGIVVWMDVDEIKTEFRVDDVEALLSSGGDESLTFDDRPKWIDTRRKRIRVCQHFYKEKGAWQMAFFTKGHTFIGPMPSPFQDEDGLPTNPIELVSAHIDRENNRYGDARYWIDLQDEINHRRSKALYLLSVRQTASRRGAIKDIEAMHNELAKGNGHIEYEGERGDFEVLPTGDMAQAQFSLLQEAKNELDSVGFNAQLSGERQGNLSGKAVNSLQQAGTNELAATFGALNHWKKRIYRQIWYRIRQFWDKEKWIRVTDDENNLRWVGINQPITLKQVLEEKVANDGLNTFERQRSAQILQQMVQSQDPRLVSVIETRNAVAELDMDIILEQVPDIVNIQNEQFQLLAQLAASRPDVSFESILKLSSIRDKDKILEEIKASQVQRQQLIAQEAAIEQANKQADTESKQAKTMKTQQEAIQTTLENQILVANPRPVTSVAI